MYGNVFDEHTNDVCDVLALRAALDYCDHCTVIDACEELTEETEEGFPLEERFGVAAGMTPRERWMAAGRPTRMEE